MIKHKHIFTIFLLLIFSTKIFAQADSIRFRVMFWNVENLFDTKHDSLKNDYESLPEATRHWTYKRYKKKIDDVARVIAAVGDQSIPALVGLCEVENNDVLQSLVHYSPLNEQTYRYALTESPDERGINIALLYQRNLFKPIETKSIRIPQIDKHNRPTRDILYVSGITITSDTLDVFVTHLPSRSGGAKETEPFRLHVANQLRMQVDSLNAIRQTPRIIIMGDFNDFPNNRSITEVLDAQPIKDNIEPNNLYHLLANQIKKDRNLGSYKFKGRWQLLDHIIVSGNLLDTTTQCYTKEEDARIARFPFLLTDDLKYGGDQPFRTYHGMKYQGGYSDHLPVYTYIILKFNY